MLTKLDQSSFEAIYSIMTKAFPYSEYREKRRSVHYLRSLNMRFTGGLSISSSLRFWQYGI